MIFYEYLFHNILVSTTSTTFDVNEFYNIDENQFYLFSTKSKQIHEY